MIAPTHGIMIKLPRTNYYLYLQEQYYATLARRECVGLRATNNDDLTVGHSFYGKWQSYSG